MGECKGLACAHAPIFSIKPDGKPTMGKSGEKIVITKAPELLQPSSKTALISSILLGFAG